VFAKHLEVFSTIADFSCIEVTANFRPMEGVPERQMFYWKFDWGDITSYNNIDIGALWRSALSITVPGCHGGSPTYPNERYERQKNK